MAESLIQYVRDRVNPKDFYSKRFTDLRWSSTSTEPRTMCVFHEDHKSPSLHVNGETGAYYCHGCKAGGNHIVSFQAALDGVSLKEAAAKLFEEFIHPVIPEDQVQRWKKALIKTPKAISYIKKRNASPAMVDQLEIGWDGSKIIFPVRNEFGICVNAKKYDSTSANHPSRPKMINHAIDGETRSFGSPPMLWPINAFNLAKEVGYIVVCEGEWDTLLLMSLDIPAVTATTGCKSWSPQYNEKFRGLTVIIAYDNDKDGSKYDVKPMKQLNRIALEIRRLKIPKRYGKDVSDWYNSNKAMRSKKSWLRQIRRADLIVKNKRDELQSDGTIPEVPLDQSSQAKWFNRRINVSALITGKDLAPYILPNKVRVSCDQSCDDCPLAKSNKPYKDIDIDSSSPSTLKMVDASQNMIEKFCMKQAGMSPVPDCHAKVDILKTFNLEQLLLIPALGSRSSQYVMNSSYFVGHGLHPNRGYKFEGLTTAHPQDQHATHLFDKATPLQDEVETFDMTNELKEQLKVFQPDKTDMMSHLTMIAEWQSRNITKIRERPDLHIAVDLVFHSVRGFDFNGEKINRGMLDVLVIGDTRCGKGQVGEGLTRYYGLGEVASGENCSFAGLIGGLEQIGKRWIVTWGLIPLNNDRMCVIDETSSIPESDISKMSRVRSEGIAEINKIKREATQANTRLLWMSNPRDGSKIMERNYGVEAIKSLIGANEDISRFDFAMSVATNEVDTKIINSRIEDESTIDAQRFPQTLCRSLILWCWSRRPDQVIFTSSAINEIIQRSIEFGKMYSSAIPLVQAENIRIKLAKISGALAARVFSTDESCELVIVKSKHVACACRFISEIYSKPSFAYDLYSKASITSNAILDIKSVESLFRELDNLRNPTIQGLLSMNHMNAVSMADYVGDVMSAQTTLSELVRLQAIYRVENTQFYMKTSTFTEWLRAYKEELSDA